MIQSRESRIRLRVPLERMDIRKSKVMMVDDHKLFLEGLQYLLEAYKVNIVGKARNGRSHYKGRILMPDIIWIL